LEEVPMRRTRTDFQPSFSLLLWIFLGLAALVLILPDSAFAAENRWTAFGPGGGEVRSLTLDPSDPDTLLAAAGLAGLYKSADGGDSWVWSGTGLAGWNIRTVAANQGHPGTFFAASGGEDFSVRGIFRSLDGGASWQRVFELDALDGIDKIVAAGDLVFVLAQSGLYRGENNGGHWHRVFTATDLTDVAIDRQDFLHLYLTSAQSLLESRNGGIQWTFPTLPRDDFRSVAIAPSRPATVYVSAGQTLYRSDDAGATWIAGAHLPDNVAELAVDPVRPSTVYAFGFEAVVSRDGGATVQEIENGLLPGRFTEVLSIWSLAIRPDRPATIYAGTYAEGVYRSTNGGRLWQPAANAGLAARQFVWVWANPRNPAQIYAQSLGQLFRSLDGGATWSDFATDIQPPYALGWVEFDRRNPHILYVGGNAGVFRSQDDGATWSRFKLDVLAHNMLAVDARTLLVGAQYGLFRSTDAGRTWRSVLDDSIPPLDNDFYVGRNILWMKSDPADPRTIYARADDYVVHFGSGFSYLVRSTDGGATWHPLRLFDVVEIEPGHPRTLYAADADRVFKSLNGGDTWQPLGALPHATDLEADPRAPGTLYAGTTQQGVYRSTDGGLTWAPLNAGLARLGRHRIVDLEVNPGTRGLVYAAPFEGGLFQGLFQ
jgi:photosystem II stability/assembly factor-like uncharacterized protein